MTDTVKTDRSSQSPAFFFKPTPIGIYLDLSLILVCVAVVFGRTLTSYFLADDFGEIHYVQRICTGDLNLLVSNFTGNYMQIPGMSVYRPFLLLSLLIDFVIWKANAFGFYATNLLFYCLDSVLLYLVVLRLGCARSDLRNRLTALTAAALFALSPLHCESVSWVLGRVDVICAFFYLLSILFLFEALKGKSKKVTGLAIAAFISALLVKEMAIGIPVIAFLLGCLYYPKGAGETGLRKHPVWRGLIFSRPYLAATVAYFAVRYLALGTFVGGYVAGFGASQEKNALVRWLDVDTLGRIAFPLVSGHFQAGELISRVLLVLYISLSTIFLIRLLAGLLPLRFFLFLAGWFVTTLVPIYKLWGIGYNLEGARFLFFFTMPLATLIAAILFQSNDNGGDKSQNKSLLMVSSAVAISIAAIFAYITAKTNLVWINAGKEVRSAARSAQAILALDKSNPAVFLGIPKESKGTHMFLCGDTFRAAVSPPFAELQPKRKFATFEPVMYSPEHDIDPPRLKTLIGQGADVFVWSSQERQFNQVCYTGEKAGSFTISPVSDSHNLQLGGSATGFFRRSKDVIVHENGNGLQGIELTELNLNPLEADFAVVELNVTKADRIQSIGACWEGPSNHQADLREAIVQSTVAPAVSGFQKVCIPLSRHWKWFQKPTVDTVFLSLPPGRSVIKSIEFASAKSCTPQMTIKQCTPNGNGIYAITREQDIYLDFDGSSIKDADSLSLEIGKANFFFDNFRETDGAEVIVKRIALPTKVQNYQLKGNVFSGSGLVQIRAKALSKSGLPIGAASPCLTFSVH